MKEEHDDFLVGLNVCGKDWTAISRRFVPSRTVTQVRTHAQKYFIKMDRGQAFPDEVRSVVCRLCLFIVLDVCLVFGYGRCGLDGFQSIK